MAKYHLVCSAELNGFLRYGHIECTVEANSKEEAFAKAKREEYDEYEVILDSYCLNGCETYDDFEIVEVEE